MATVALGEIGHLSAEAVSTLVQLLRSDPEERVRSAAARALGRTAKGSSPSGEVITALLQALQDSDPTVRAEAAEALGLCAPPTSEVIQALEAAARSEDFALRQAAEQALLDIRSRNHPKK
jgi:HEAT repeat protein